MDAPYLQLRAISKRFPGVVALSRADLDVRAGEAIALMGANGAGKSTLMNILGGVVGMDEGEILIGGVPVTLRSPIDAIQHGIAFVHQELNSLPTMTIAENVFIDGFPSRLGQIDFAQCQRRTAEILVRLGSDLDPRQPVAELSIGDRQLVEIARALRRNPRILIFDEPTSSLSLRERERLFDVIRALKSDGVAIIYITHFVDEIFAVCDAVSVMRNGATVFTGTIGKVSAARRRPPHDGRGRERAAAGRQSAATQRYRARGQRAFAGRSAGWDQPVAQGRRDRRHLGIARRRAHRIAACAGRAGSDRRGHAQLARGHADDCDQPTAVAAKNRLRHRGSARRRPVPAAVGRRQHRAAQPGRHRAAGLHHAPRAEAGRRRDDPATGHQGHRRRSAGGDAVRRQSAKGGVRALARHRAETVPARRADARPRCRRQDGDPETGQRAGRCRHGSADGLVGRSKS